MKNVFAHIDWNDGYTLDDLMDWREYYEQIEHFPEFCANHLIISVKGEFKDQENLAPLILNFTQMKVFDEFKADWLAGILPKYIILKARQHGISTLSAALEFWYTQFHNNKSAVFITHTTSATSQLYGMFRRFYDNLPDSLRWGLVSQDQHRLVYEEANGSMVRVYTAGTPNSTSSTTNQFVHGSEVAKWERDKETLASLMPTCKQGIVIFESTAFGIGNEFYVRWNNAVAGIGNFKPIFIAWWENPEYCLAPSPGEPPMEYTKDERFYAEKFKLSENQMRWWRATFTTECACDISSMRQEYPSSAEEAFIGSGNPYFNLDAVLGLIHSLEAKPPTTDPGRLLWDEDGRIYFRPADDIDENGYPNGLVVYHHPVSGDRTKNRYTLGVDSSEGIDRQNTGATKRVSKDTDYNCIVVWDKVEKRQVAFSRNKLDFDELGEMACRLCVYYRIRLREENNDGTFKSLYYYSMLVIEKNSTGLAVIKYCIKRFRELKIPNGRLYNTTGNLSSTEDVPTEYVGWRTMDTNKKMLLSVLQTALRESYQDNRFKDKTGILSKTIANECKAFVTYGNGKVGSLANNWDDGVMSYCLAREGERIDYAPSWQVVEKKVTGWRAKFLHTANKAGVSFWDK